MNESGSGYPSARVRLLSAGCLVLLLSGTPGLPGLRDLPAQSRSRHVSLSPPERFVYEEWGVEDGLPANQITDIVQTPDGYLWLSTFDGLVRFDGNRFVVYNVANSEGLPSNRIPDLHVSRSGDLWLLTETQQIVRLRDGAFRTFGTEDGLRGAVLSWHEDRDGTMWVGTERDVARIVGDSVRPLELEPLGFRALAIVVDRSGALWIGRPSGVQRRLRGETKTFVAGNGFPGGPVRNLFEAPDGTIWVLSTRDVARIAAGRVIPTDLPGLWGGGNDAFVTDGGGELAAIVTTGKVIEPGTGRPAGSG